MRKQLYSEPHDIIINKHHVTLTHCSKIIFPDHHITKADVIDYYLAIAPHMVPHLVSRPLTLLRFVNGITEEGFYQKEAADYFPAWITRKKVPKKSGGFTQYVVCNNAATLVYLTNQLTLTYHAWLSKTDALTKPDRMIFDLDPAGKADFKDVAAAARLLHDYFAMRHIMPRLMTTGSRGVHVIISLKRNHTFDTVRAVARSIAEWCVNQKPELVTLESRLKKRDNKIYLDVLRNAYAQTSVAPYSVRARPGAPVATPISWDELFAGSIRHADQFTIKTIFDRLKHTNPWHHEAHSVSLDNLKL